jgi:hypothetical protein
MRYDRVAMGRTLGRKNMSAAAFLQARDFLLARCEDYETAYREFRWPVLESR